jgi:monovalent cation:H+ antiporter-2, CPA2 family
MAVDTSTLLFEFGVVMLLGFIGAAIAFKARQSAVLGYIVVGILIGPAMYIHIGGFTYTGLVQETGFISALSDIGILLLIFFVGLEFSVEKIKKVKGPAVILSLIDVGINMFVGFLLAFGLGWPLIDSIFLAAVMAMSCSAVAMKTLIELDRMSKPETEYIMGMVILEEFISMVFLTVVGGLVLNTDADFTVSGMLIGMAGFFIFFIVLALVVIPRVIGYLTKMKSDELFVIFMLAVVLLSAWFAEECGVPKLIGAFFIGMVFAETKIMDRMEKKIAPLRDAFVAIFFVSFGMLIDPSMFFPVLPVIAIAIVLMLLAEMVVMPVIAYLIGFNRRASVQIGASFSARGGESVMYASIGSQSAGATMGAELNPIAGGLTFIMSALCPFFIKRSYDIADYFAMKFPASIRYGAAVFSRTLGKLVFPSTFRPFKITWQFLGTLMAIVVGLIATASTEGLLHIVFFAFSIVMCVSVWFIMVKNMRKIVRQIDYSNLGAVLGSDEKLTKYIATSISLGLVMCASVCFMFPLLWQSVIVISLAYVCWFTYLMKVVYDSTCSDSRYIKIAQDKFTGKFSSFDSTEKKNGMMSLDLELEYRKREK